MWMGSYTALNLLGVLFQSIFIQNMIFATFLGMCTYLACSNRLSTANGLGVAVVFVMVVAGTLNWFVHQFITGEGALSWLGFLGIDTSNIDLSFLEFLIYISVIAGFVQVLEIVIEKFSPALYGALGMYLPLITVNCAILGASLLATTRNYPFWPNLVYVLGSGLGWWLAIVLIACIRQKLGYSNVVLGLRGMGITFLMTGLMAMVFMGLQGIDLSKPSGEASPPEFDPSQSQQPI